MTTCVRKGFIDRGRHKGVAAIFVSFKATEDGIDGPVEELVDDIAELLKTSSNFDGTFVHSASKMMYWLVFDGDDPMRHQSKLTDIVSELFKRELITPRIIIRCGARHPIEEDMGQFIYDFHVRECYGGFVPDSYGSAFVLFEIDLNLGKRSWDELVDTRAIFSYLHCAPLSYFMAKHNGGKMRWFEIGKIAECAKENDCEMPFHICPTDDLDVDELDEVLDEASERGYYIG